MPPPDLRNKLHFPSFSALPYDNDADFNYYNDDKSPGVLQPSRHWCGLAEIVETLPWIRPMYRVRDVKGDMWMVAYHLDDRSLFPQVAAQCKIGHTLCVMYANRHAFMDGQQGLRIENEDTAKVLPCSLKAVLRVSDRVKAGFGKCKLCKKETTTGCVRCQTGYCSQVCLRSDAKTHKDECVVTQQLQEWGGFDWRHYDHFRCFPESTSVAPAPARGRSNALGPSVARGRSCVPSPGTLFVIVLVAFVVVYLR